MDTSTLSRLEGVEIFTMRPLASPIVALLFMFASKVAAQTLRETHVVDYRTLKTCDSKTVSISLLLKL